MQWIVCRCIGIIRRLYASGHTAFQEHRYRTRQCSRSTVSYHEQEDEPPSAVRGGENGYFNVTGAADVARKRSTGRFFVCTTVPYRCRGPPVRSSIKNSDKEVIRYVEAE